MNLADFAKIAAKEPCPRCKKTGPKEPVGGFNLGHIPATGLCRCSLCGHSAVYNCRPQDETAAIVSRSDSADERPKRQPART